jgi:mono/diheme cytochrome c family protein
VRFLTLLVMGAWLVSVSNVVRPQELRDKNPEAKRTQITSGEKTFLTYCASCHGIDGTGNGPVAKALKPPPTNLTLIAKNNGGRFPAGFVGAVLKFGRNLSAHGSQDMPVWGALFKTIDPVHDPSGQKHINDVVAYIESLQTK